MQRQRQNFVVNQKESVHCHKERDSRMVNNNNNNELEPFITMEADNGS
jgi:hypothetical protein